MNTADNLLDTIVAPITGQPPAAVAWIRLSGPDAYRIASEVFDPWPNPVVPRRASFGSYANGDDGLALPFEAGHSYTGEESVELSMHGSRVSVRSVVEACVEAGARLAGPGEFTMRAFLNGRIDLTQAEAVRDTVDAETEVQLRYSSENRKGLLRDVVSAIRENLSQLLVKLEASVDFSEEIGEFDRAAALKVVERAHMHAQFMLTSCVLSRNLRHGYRIAIVGPPNSGKSSLLNRLLGTERAIVTPIPGTTRDFVEERVDIGGVPAVVIDTAGLRETDDPVERIGIERALEQAEKANEVWFVYDGQVGPGPFWEQLSAGWDQAQLFANKSDLGPTVGPGHAISAATGEGLGSILEELAENILDDSGEVFVNERQAFHLMHIVPALSDLINALGHEGPDDLLSVLLSDVIAMLGRITGETADADMIEQIFHDFCVGK